MAGLSKKKDFLKDNHLTEGQFKSTGLEWEDLEAIHKDYLSIADELDSTANYLFNRLRRAEAVHSVKFRIKSPDSLIRKIIRKKVDKPSREITLDNYRSEMRDLIDLRVLHLYKEDWLPINSFIQSTFTLNEGPKAKIRTGDRIKEFFEHNRCEVEEQHSGYRSIHYVVESKPAKRIVLAEVQVRTIYEEAWSEIDHDLRYPVDVNNPLINQLLLILNLLSGGADEMGSYVKLLKQDLQTREVNHAKQIKEKDALISKLQKQIEDNPQIEKAEKAALKDDLKRLKEIKEPGYFGLSDISNLGSSIANILTAQSNIFSNMGLSIDHSQPWYLKSPLGIEALAKEGFGLNQNGPLHKMGFGINPNEKISLAGSVSTDLINLNTGPLQVSTNGMVPLKKLIEKDKDSSTDDK